MLANPSRKALRIVGGAAEIEEPTFKRQRQTRLR